MDEPIWCLRIVFAGGDTADTYGRRSDLEPVFEAWAEGGFLDGSRIVVRGHHDTADRAPLYCAYKPDEVRGMGLWRT